MTTDDVWCWHETCEATGKPEQVGEPTVEDGVVVAKFKLPDGWKAMPDGSWRCPRHAGERVTGL